MKKTKKILVGGCFNRIHPGHIYFLKEAKKFGLFLTVVLTHDDNNHKITKTCVEDRILMLKELKIIDKVIIGDKKDFSKVLKKEKPDLIVLGYDQTMPKIKTEHNKGYLYTYIRLKKYKNYHTCTQS